MGIEQEKDILAQLSTTEGLTAEALFDKTEVVQDRFELGKNLHRLQQLGSVYKKDKLYFKVDMEPSESEDEDESLESELEPTVGKPRLVIPPSISFGERRKDPPVRFESAPKPKTEVEKSVKERPRKMGRLKRQSISGPFAMALFLYWKHDRLAMSIQKLLEATGTTNKPTSFYVALNNMVTGGYLSKAGYGCYVWSGNFDYPFSSIREEDEKMVKQLPPALRGEAPMQEPSKQQTGAEVTPIHLATPVENQSLPHEVESVSDSELDFLIANLQSSVRSINEQIELLRKIRERKMQAAA